MDNVYDESILTSLRRITRSLDLHSRRLVSQHQLTAPQLICLRLLAKNGPMSPSLLAKQATLSQATVSGIIDRLERRGLVERRRDRADRRQISLHLSAEGRALATNAPPPLQERFSRRLQSLGSDRQAEIDSILRQIAQMMEEAENEPNQAM